MCTSLPNKHRPDSPRTPDRRPVLDSPPAVDSVAVAEFAAAVLGYYQSNSRPFPWRETSDPWRILVSELMLQQTQTQRVLPKYLAWFETFPDMAALAAAPLESVYAAWKGLGYNNRALRLRETAKQLCSQHGGQVPANEQQLLALPGIGQYTARAILAFAWEQPTIFLETNIRSALIFHFFDKNQPAAAGTPATEKISDRQLMPLAEASLGAALARGQSSRHWYYALMDYGVYLKKMEVNPSRRSRAYSRQSKFEGSLRQVRGAVLASLQIIGPSSIAALGQHTGYAPERLEQAAESLVAEGLLYYENGKLGFRD